MKEWDRNIGRIRTREGETEAGKDRWREEIRRNGRKKV